jgi:hypothetical protein
MEPIFDDMAKQLATAGSRRDMLSIAFRAVGAAFLGFAGIARVRAQTQCPQGHYKCGTVCCDSPNGYHCCSDPQKSPTNWWCCRKDLGCSTVPYDGCG